MSGTGRSPYHNGPASRTRRSLRNVMLGIDTSSSIAGGGGTGTTNSGGPNSTTSASTSRRHSVDTFDFESGTPRSSSTIASGANNNNNNNVASSVSGGWQSNNHPSSSSSNWTLHHGVSPSGNNTTANYNDPSPTMTTGGTNLSMRVGRESTGTRNGGSSNAVPFNRRKLLMRNSSSSRLLMRQSSARLNGGSGGGGGINVGSLSWHQQQAIEDLNSTNASSENGDMLLRSSASEALQDTNNTDDAIGEESNSDNSQTDMKINSSPLTNSYSRSQPHDKITTMSLDENSMQVDKDASTVENTKKDPNHDLRNLTVNILSSNDSTCCSTSSPPSAVFYASMLYTKSQLDKDAILYAKALVANGEKRRAVFLLDRAGLLSYDLDINRQQKWIHDFKGGGNRILQDENYKEHVRQVMEAKILAAQCLSSFGEWEDVALLLEDGCRYPPLPLSENFTGVYGQDNHNSFIESATDRRIISLTKYLASTVAPTDIHPLARLCSLRGMAYDEASNPTRAASFLKAALKIDVKCIEAWDVLCRRHLLSTAEERDLVMDLNFEDADGCNITWLRDVYYARLTHASVSNDCNSNQIMGTPIASDAIGGMMDESMQWRKKGISSPHLETSSASMFATNNPNMPHMSMDASSIKFQPSPSTPLNFTQKDRRDRSEFEALPVNGDMMGKKDRPPSPPQVNKITRMNTIDSSQIEEAFQNLHSKHHLSKSPEILTLAASRAYKSYNLPLALYYCQSLLDIDPLCPKAAHIQIATLTGLGHKRSLFRLSHALVDSDPKSAIAWYAVGCYYQTCGRFDLAQRYFCRATRLDPRNAECWIAFGCAFASCDENDQANACFRAAQRLHSGSHYPMLYMGMEHLRTNNVPLAGHFLKSARSMGKDDPLCCNELGVWAYRKKEWSGAESWFLMALKLVVDADITGRPCICWNSDKENKDNNVLGQDSDNTGNSFLSTSGDIINKRISQKETVPLSQEDCVQFCQEAFWEPTIFNLGQVYRKQGKFQNAIICFEKCLALCPGNASSFSALGFTCHIQGDIDGAIESYHQALSRKPDDTFASEMLNRALQDQLDSVSYSGTSTAQTPGSHDVNLFSSPLASPHGMGNLTQDSSAFKETNESAIFASYNSNMSQGDSDVDMSVT